MHTYLTKPKEEFKDELKKRITDGDSILMSNYIAGYTHDEIEREFNRWDDYNLELLKQSFNHPYNEYHKAYERSILFLEFPKGTSEAARLLKRIETKIDNLRMLETKLPILREKETKAAKVKSNKKQESKTQIFIVHGHDDLAKTETARFIEQLGFEAIILHEQASSGMTIIEKIESYTNVGFGIVLYTPCDIGAKKGNEVKLKSRARQNVVFEHGYLIGKIGRKNVVALVKGDIEKPNDISGVVYISMDNNDWRVNLAKELRKSGYSIDFNKLL